MLIAVLPNDTNLCVRMLVYTLANIAGDIEQAQRQLRMHGDDCERHIGSMPHVATMRVLTSDEQRSDLEASSAGQPSTLSEFDS